MILRFLSALLLVALASCSSMPWNSSRYALKKPDEVPGAVSAAQSDFEAGRTAQALERVTQAREVGGLDAQTRDQLDLATERYATRRIEELSRPGSDPEELEELTDLKLPQQLSVSAGVDAARLYLEKSRPYKAYRVLKKLETNYPRHHGRAEAGDILLDAGLKLARSNGGFWFWSDRDDGIEVLEFLVLTYPSERRCDQAFAELARLYEEDRDYGVAIQRHEELLFSHPDSPLVIASQARIPHLRLLATESPEYDRKELLRARKEIEDWIGAHAGDALEAQVRVDYADCLQRLVRSDLGIARFYRRITQPYGARFHATRALQVARETGNEKLIHESEAVLQSLPQVSDLPEARKVDEKDFAHDATDVRSALESQKKPEADTQSAKEPAKPAKP